MHLIELIAELEAVKVARGNILLVDALAVASGDAKPLVDYSNRRERQAPAELVIDLTGMSEEEEQELRAESPQATFVRHDVVHPRKPGCNLVDVTKGACTLEDGHEGDHVWENPDADAAEKVHQATTGETRDPNNEADGAKVIEERTDLKTAESQLGQVMEDAAAKLPGGADPNDNPQAPAPVAHVGGQIHGMGQLQPCSKWDGKGHQCLLAEGHEGHHRFKPLHE